MLDVSYMTDVLAEDEQRTDHLHSTVGISVGVWRKKRYSPLSSLTRGGFKDFMQPRFETSFAAFPFGVFVQSAGPTNAQSIIFASPDSTPESA